MSEPTSLPLLSPEEIAAMETRDVMTPEERDRLLAGYRALEEEAASARRAFEVEYGLEAEARVETLQEELARWKVCENCGESLTGPGICDKAISEKEKGLEEMCEQALTRAEKAEADLAALREQVRKLPNPIEAVTAGASPQKDGGMLPPLWHVNCRWCGKRWSITQWKHPQIDYAGHPANGCLALTRGTTDAPPEVPHE